MTITLQVVDGTEKGRKIFLQPGQRATVGRAAEADYQFSANSGMSSVHFAVNCEWPECYVHDLDSSTGTLLNGEPVMYAELHHGDELRAGENAFHVSLSEVEETSSGLESVDTAAEAATQSGASAAPEPATMVVPLPEGMPQVNPVRDEPPGFLPGTVGEICARIEDLEDAARQLLEEGQTHEQYVAALESAELYVDASRFLAHALARRDAVEWAVNCVQHACGTGLSAADAHALEVTRAWVDDPTEAHRRAAEQAAQALEHKTPASWAATGAVWSEGNLAPVDAPVVVPPQPHFTALAVAGSVMLAAVDKEPEKQSEKYHEFFRMGLKQGASIAS